MKAIILDDEINGALILSTLIVRYCPDVEILEVITKPEQALEKIESSRPDLLFLDIHMPNINGFEVSKAISYPIGIILTTAFDEYAIKAFKIDAIDYLLKPIDYKELIVAVNKARVKLNKNLRSDPISMNSSLITRVAVPVTQGIQYINIGEISRMQSDGILTIFYLTNGKTITSSRNVGYFNNVIESSTLFRTHKSHVVNTMYIHSYNNKEGGQLTMTNGEKVPVARERKEQYLNFMKKYSL